MGQDRRHGRDDLWHAGTEAFKGAPVRPGQRLLHERLAEVAQQAVLSEELMSARGPGVDLRERTVRGAEKNMPAREKAARCVPVVDTAIITVS